MLPTPTANPSLIPEPPVRSLIDLSTSTAGQRAPTAALVVIVIMALKQQLPRHSLLPLLLLALAAVQAAVPPLEVQLQVGFYARSCPRAEAIVRHVVRRHAARDYSVLPALIRLHFHDCFVRVCARRPSSSLVGDHLDSPSPSCHVQDYFLRL